MFNETKSQYRANMHIRLLCLGVFASMALYLNGCILDAFNTLTQEIPLGQKINISGSETTIERTQAVNLNSNDFYKSNQEKIKHIKFVKIAYKTKSVSPAGLQGNIELTVKQSNGIVIFSKVIPGNKPSDYLVNPFELTLNASEIQAMNAYLSVLSNREFIAAVKVQTVTPGVKTLDAEIFAVFEMDYDL